MNTREWERLRANGRLHYSLLDGALLKGSKFLTAFCVTSPLVYDTTGQFLAALPYAAVAFPLAGTLANVVLWPIYEGIFVSKKERTASKRSSEKKGLFGKNSRNNTVKKLKPKTA